MTDLANKLADDEENEINELERFKVTNLEQANWALRKITKAKRQMTENKKLADDEIDRINTWLQKENELANNSIAYLESLLGEYLTELRKEDEKAKISTPYGKVSMEKQQPSWEYDEPKLIAFLKFNNFTDFIKVEETPKKAEIKKAFRNVNGRAVTADGEVIEGISITEQPDKIVVKVVE